MKIGVIGRGRWGQVYLESMRSMGMEIAWVCGKDDLRFDAPAVIIATPPATHFELARRALLLGRHVLLEKPMALSFDDCERLYLLARRFGVVAFTGHTHLYSPEWSEVKYRMSGRMGKQVGVGYIGGTPQPGVPKWWCKGSHLVAMAVDLYGAPRQVSFKEKSESLEVAFENATATLFLRDERIGPYFSTGWCEYAAKETRPTAMQCLLGEFHAAIVRGEPDSRGFALGREVARVLKYAPA
jgi:predicted dehydrogenase